MSNTIAQEIMSNKNNLDIKLRCEAYSVKTFVLFGSKIVIYNFRDESIIRWIATPNIFEIQE